MIVSLFDYCWLKDLVRYTLPRYAGRLAIEDRIDIGFLIRRLLIFQRTRNFR